MSETLSDQISTLRKWDAFFGKRRIRSFLSNLSIIVPCNLHSFSRYIVCCILFLYTNILNKKRWDRKKRIHLLPEKASHFRNPGRKIWHKILPSPCKILQSGKNLIRIWYKIVVSEILHQIILHFLSRSYIHFIFTTNLWWYFKDILV
jgi:hypothetical protein